MLPNKLKAKLNCLGGIFRSIAVVIVLWGKLGINSTCSSRLCCCEEDMESFHPGDTPPKVLFFNSQRLDDTEFLNNNWSLTNNLDWSRVFGITIWRLCYCQNQFQLNQSSIDSVSMIKDIIIRA